MVKSIKSSVLGRLWHISLVSGLFLIPACSTMLTGRLFSTDTNFHVPADARINVSKIDAKEDEPRNWVLTVKEDGTFATEKSLPEGNYLVEAVVPGYRLASVNIQLKESRKIDLKLEPLAKTATRSIDPRDSDESLNRGQGEVRIIPPQL